MTRIPVKSGQIKSVGYNPAEKTLEVEFHSHGNAPNKPNPTTVYQYQHVTPQQHADMIASESVGSYFYKHLRPHKDKHPFKKIA